MSTSRAYHHGDLRSALLATTRTLLSEGGVEGLNLREVSRRTGVSHAAAYNHFQHKACLVRAVVDAAFARLVADMRRARSSTDDPFEALRRIGVAYVYFAYCNPAEFQLMFRPELSAVPDVDAMPQRDVGYQLLVETVEECQEAGMVAQGPVEPLVLAAWSMVHGVSSLIVDGPEHRLATTVTAAEALARQCLYILEHGLRTNDATKVLKKSSARKSRHVELER